MHGYGVYQFANGHRYEGSWHEGRKQGLGIYTFRNGETHAGHWHHGVLETRSSQNPAPNSPTAVYHSKVLNAVQVGVLSFLLECMFSWSRETLRREQKRRMSTFVKNLLAFLSRSIRIVK